jgi:hypothetical protein
MVAPLILLNHELALTALAIVKVPLKELHLVSVAVPLVPTQKALRAKLRLAFVANHNPLDRTADESFAVLLWAQFYVWVVGRNVKLVQFSVGFLHVGGELFEELSGCVDEGTAVLPRTVHFFEHFDFVNGVVVQTRLAEVLFVFAATKV